MAPPIKQKARFKIKDAKCHLRPRNKEKQREASRSSPQGVKNPSAQPGFSYHLLFSNSLLNLATEIYPTSNKMKLIVAHLRHAVLLPVRYKRTRLSTKRKWTWSGKNESIGNKRILIPNALRLPSLCNSYNITLNQRAHYINVPRFYRFKGVLLVVMLYLAASTAPSKVKKKLAYCYALSISWIFFSFLSFLVC